MQRGWLESASGSSRGVSAAGYRYTRSLRIAGLALFAKVNGLLLVKENGFILLLKIKPKLQLKVEDFE
jgi:hypothetical protein